MDLLLTNGQKNIFLNGTIALGCGKLWQEILHEKIFQPFKYAWSDIINARCLECVSCHHPWLHHTSYHLMIHSNSRDAQTQPGQDLHLLQHENYWSFYYNQPLIKSVEEGHVIVTCACLENNVRNPSHTLKKGYSKALENLKILNIIFLSKAMTNLIDFLWLVNLWSLQQVMTEWNLKRWNHLFLAQCIQWIFHGLFNWLKHPTEVRPLVFTEYNVA